MPLLVLCILALAASAVVLRAQETGSVRTADGFQCPVGVNGDGAGYYLARGYRENGHLGEDWNGVKGGDTDLGDPVFATAHGLVVFARNYHVGWGNVVILRHAYHEGLSVKFVDSLYGHLQEIAVREGQEVRRGQRVGSIGNNGGMYDAHLHFEMRKNLTIGMFRGSFARDFSNYWSPQQFIAAHRTCSRGGRMVSVPINTFPLNAPPSFIAGARVDTPTHTAANAPKPAFAGLKPPTASDLPEPEVFLPRSGDALAPGSTAKRKPAPVAPGPAVFTNSTSVSPIRRSTQGFRVDRFEDLRPLGY